MNEPKRRHSDPQHRPNGQRFVALADLHAHPWAAFASGDGLENDRLCRTLDVLARSLEQAQQLAVPWVFAGDLVHTAGYALNVVLTGVTETLCRFPHVPKLAVWGNHDARGVGGRIYIEQTIWAALRRAVPNLYMLDSVDPIRGYTDGLTFAGTGAQPRPDLVALAPTTDVGVYHGIVRGTVGPNGYVFTEGLEPRALLERHRVTIIGDVHHPQHLPAPPGQLLLVPGSPEHHNFGDVGPHGWWVVTVPQEGTPTAEFVPSGSPEFRTVEVPGDAKADGNFYRIRTVPVGAALPEYAVAIAPSPTVVEGREAFRGAFDPEQLLALWLKEHPPEGDLADHLAVGRQLLGTTEPRRLRPLRLVQLHLRNFCCYAEQVFTIKPGTWLVVGQGRDYPSNGAGKSTLFEALFWLLFGRTTKGLTGDDVVRWDTTGCEVGGTFRDDRTGSLLAVIRRRDDGDAPGLEIAETRPDGTIARMEGTSIADLTSKLGRHLGLTPELFQALGYFSQERLLLFASATDGERKDMLADLVGLSQYQIAAAAAAVQAANREQQLATVRARREERTGQLAQAQARANTAQLAAAAWEEARERALVTAAAAVTRFDRETPERRAQLAAAIGDRLGETIARRLSTLRATRGEEPPAAKVIHANLTLAERELRAAQQWCNRAREAGAARATLSASLQSQLTAIRARLAQHAQQLAAGRCPTCGQAVTAAHRERCLAEERREEARLLAEVQTAEAAVAKALAEAEAATAALDREEQFGRDWKAHAERRLRYDSVTEMLAAAEQERTAVAAAATAEAVNQLTKERAGLVAEQEQIARADNPHAAERQRADAAVQQAAALLAELDTAERQTMREQAAYAYWEHGFSKHGIQSLLLEEVAALFNAGRGDIFPTLTQGIYDVQLSVTSQTKGGELRERTAFVVFERGAPVPYAALSGGQRRRIDIGVMLVLVLAVSQWLQVPGVLGLLILDEVFGFLDQSGAEGLMEALAQAQGRIPAIYAITHDPQLQSLFPTTLTVVQGADGTSRVLEMGNAS